jgi:signal transduction histidine kinase
VPANQLFRELLATNPNDEAAAIGLVQNLLLQNKGDDARREVEQALARHPNSRRLQEYRDDLLKNQLPLAASREGNALNRVQADANYFSDTTGNRALRAGQRFDLQLGRNLTNSFRPDEKSLWVSQGPMPGIRRIGSELSVLCPVSSSCWFLLRVRQIARSIGARFDERLAERTLIARDLHDTFLQTIQGSKLVADDALDPSTDPLRMRRALEQLSVWFARATQEGRAALNSLRTTTIRTNDLAKALRRVTEDSLIPSSMAVTFSVIGDSKEMHPIVRDEIYRIGYEAIRNACMHSGASRLQVELRYANDLALRVNDNGAGIDPAIADGGRDRHFGLQGMRERTARIGGKLTLVSSSSSGTEIKLVVPGGIVFGKTMPVQQSLFMKIRSLFGSKRTRNLD